MLFFDPELTNVFRDLLPWAGTFFRMITELGSETFYIALVLAGFWAYKKREAVLTIFVLLTSVVLNYLLKIIIMNPRPDQSYWYPGIEANNYSTPSGHAQNSAALFGWFAVRARKWWMYILSVTLIVLIGLSRIYLGVHYLGDVLIGWAIGFAIVIFFMFAEQPIRTFSEGKENQLYALMFLFGIALIIITSYIIPEPVDDNFGALGGLITGLAIAFPLEKRFVNFEVEPRSGQKWKLVLRVIIGLILVIGTLIALSPILPSENVWLRATRYAIVSIMGVVVWPLIFKRIDL